MQRLNVQNLPPTSEQLRERANAASNASNDLKYSVEQAKDVKFAIVQIQLNNLVNEAAVRRHLDAFFNGASLSFAATAREVRNENNQARHADARLIREANKTIKNLKVQVEEAYDYTASLINLLMRANFTLEGRPTLSSISKVKRGDQPIGHTAVLLDIARDANFLLGELVRQVEVAKSNLNRWEASRQASSTLAVIDESDVQLNPRRQSCRAVIGMDQLRRRCLHLINRLKFAPPGIRADRYAD